MMEQKNEVHTRIDDRIYSLLVVQIYKRAYIGIIATIVNAAILFIVLWNQVNHWKLIVWLSIIESYSAARIILNRNFLRKSDKKDKIRLWGRLLIIEIGIVGIIWGSTGLFLYPVDSVVHQALIAFVLAGMVAGAVGVFSLILPVFLAFSIPALLPITVRFLVEGNEVHLGMGAMTIFFAILTYITAKHIHRSNIELFELKETFADQLKERTIDLSKANEELEAFSYSVAHDLRNPLNNIGAMVDVLQSCHRDSFDDEGAVCVNIIEKNVSKMANLISDLLQLSQISRQQMRITSVDLGVIASDIADMMKKNNPQRDVEIIIHDGIIAEADQNLIKLAIDNLFCNAWKYSSTSEHAAIEFGVQNEDDDTVFFIKDNGIGFDMKNAERIFTPFQRAHTDKEFKGTGIGLSIVKRIIEKHGGRIWAEAEIGKGACFYFTLPKQLPVS